MVMDRSKWHPVSQIRHCHPPPHSQHQWHCCSALQQLVNTSHYPTISAAAGELVTESDDLSTAEYFHMFATDQLQRLEINVRSKYFHTYASN